MTKKKEADFLQVQDKSLPVCPVFASALQPLATTRYLTKKSSAQLIIHSHVQEPAPKGTGLVSQNHA